MRFFLILIILISFSIMAVSAASQMVAVAGEPFPSLYKEDMFSLFPLDVGGSFFYPYSLHSDFPFLLRKLGHFVLYGFLATFLFFVAPLKSLGWRGLVASASSSFIGLMDELHQYVMINRSGRIFDVYINTAGSMFFVAITVLLFYIFQRIREFIAE